MSAAVEEHDEEPDEDTPSVDGPKEPRVLVQRPAPMKPADLLSERRTLARRMFGKSPDAQKFRDVAEKFGIDSVAETAAEAGMNEESLTALIISLDRINAAMRRDPKRKHLYRTPAKKPADRRARELLGIEEPEPEES
jgi:hypothetical protein